MKPLARSSMGLALVAALLLGAPSVPRQASADSLDDAQKAADKAKREGYQAGQTVDDVANTVDRTEATMNTAKRTGKKLGSAIGGLFGSKKKSSEAPEVQAAPAAPAAPVAAVEARPPMEIESKDGRIPYERIVATWAGAQAAGAKDLSVVVRGVRLEVGAYDATLRQLAIAAGADGAEFNLPAYLPMSEARGFEFGPDESGEAWRACIDAKLAANWKKLAAKTDNALEADVEMSVTATEVGLVDRPTIRLMRLTLLSDQKPMARLSGMRLGESQEAAVASDARQ